MHKTVGKVLGYEVLEDRIALDGAGISVDASPLSEQELSSEFVTVPTAEIHTESAQEQELTSAQKISANDISDPRIREHIAQISGSDAELSGVELHQAGRYILFSFAEAGARETGILDTKDEFAFDTNIGGSRPLEEILQNAGLSGNFQSTDNTLSDLLALESIQEIEELYFTENGKETQLYIRSIGTTKSGESIHVCGIVTLEAHTKHEKPEYKFENLFNESTQHSKDISYQNLPPALQAIAEDYASQYPGSPGSDFVSP